jgi:hypothetical protein
MRSQHTSHSMPESAENDGQNHADLASKQRPDGGEEGGALSPELRDLRRPSSTKNLRRARTPGRRTSGGGGTSCRFARAMAWRRPRPPSGPSPSTCRIGQPVASGRDPRNVYAFTAHSRDPARPRRTRPRKPGSLTDPTEEPFHFNWNAAIAQSTHDPNTVYYGSQHVHRSTKTPGRLCRRT